RADVVALAPLDVLAEQRRDQLVAAHAHVAVDPPERHHVAVLAERLKPGQGVVVVGVDERAVDVEDRRVRRLPCGHQSLLPDARRVHASPNQSHANSAHVAVTMTTTVVVWNIMSVSSRITPFIASASSAMPAMVCRVPSLIR